MSPVSIELRSNPQRGSGGAEDRHSGNLNGHGYVVRVRRWYSPHVFKKNHVLQRFLRTSGAVFNASDRRLTDVEVEALALGPGFVPWPSVGTAPAAHAPPDYYGREIVPFINRINTAIHFSDPRRVVFDRVGSSAASVGHLAASGWLREVAESAGDGGWTAPPRQWTSDPAAAGLLRGVSALRRRMVGVSSAEQTARTSSSSSQLAISEALRSLHSDPTVRVCLSDKGSTVVVWSRDSYRREALHHLSTSGCYRELSGGGEECRRLVQVAADERGRLADRLRGGGNITQAECAAIKSASSFPSPIRFHPKLHKPVNDSTGTFRGRPIVSTLRSACRPLDKYLAVITRPLLNKIPFSLTSTSDLLTRLRDLNDRLPTDFQYLERLGIYTADVVSLFPSVRWEGGVSACVAFYRDWHPWLVRFFKTEKKLAPPSPELFEDLAKFVIRNSYIHFAETDSYYHQTSGVAMGACISVYVANCYVWSAMRPVCVDFGLAWKTSSSSDGSSGSSDIVWCGSGLRPHSSSSSSESGDILFLARYVDDFICITRSAASFDFVLTSISSNSTSNSIVFTTPPRGDNGLLPRSGVPFLDLALSIDSAAGSIQSSPRLDSSPGCSYLHAGSCHPPQLLRSIPYAQFLRLRRNSSDFNTFLSSAAVVKARLKMRGYSDRVLKQALARASRLQPNSNTRPSSGSRNFKFIATFDGGLPRHWRSVRRLLDDVVARASDFYERDSNPIGGMLGQSKASLVFNTFRPRRR